jgi:hypothetical protein
VLRFVVQVFTDGWSLTPFDKSKWLPRLQQTRVITRHPCWNYLLKPPTRRACVGIQESTRQKWMPHIIHQYYLGSHDFKPPDLL